MARRRASVAVVGAGAAGTAAAWRVHGLLGGEVDLTVFERGPHAGGRAWDVEFAGTRVEVGGTVLHSTGRHTRALMALTGAREGTPGVGIDGKDETYAFWTDRGFPVLTRSSAASMAWGIVRHTGLRSALRVTSAARGMAGRWTRVYDLQAAGTAWETPQEMLGALGLEAAAAVPLHDELRRQGVSRRMLDDVVVPIVHNMYNQGGEINALAGEVGLAGAGLAGGHLFGVEGGNWTLFARTLDLLGADVRTGTAVTAVDGTAGDAGVPRFRVTTAAGGTTEHDAVVVAAPFALADLALTVDGAPLAHAVHPYQQVHATFVVGEPSPAYFGARADRPVPSTVFTADSAGAPFQSIGVTGYSPVHRARIYKIFSADAPVGQDVLDRVFSRIDDAMTFVWRGAYPKLTPGLAHVPFVLRPGLYYACAFETAASAIEVAAVGGHNAGTLAARHLGAA